jgi:hypothetical protein
MIKLAIAALVVGVLAAATWLFRLISKPAPLGEVRGSPSTMGCGVLALAMAIVVCALGASGRAWESDQLVPWLLTLLGFGLPGVWMIWSQRGVKLSYDASGVRRRSGEWCCWRDIQRLRQPWGGPGVVVVFAKGRSLGMTPDTNGLADFLFAALDAGVPGADQFVKRDQPSPS